MQSREGQQEMISGSERDKFNGNGPKGEGDVSMKTLTSTKVIVDIGTLKDEY